MMRTTIKRRLSGMVLLVAAVVALFWGHRQLVPVMRHLAYLTGWLLLAVCLFLTAYNARKKLPFLPLGNSRTWLQIHAYVGYFSLALFFAHTGWRWPSGAFEAVLASLYLAVAASGVAGLVWSRIVPRRLTARGCEALYERIPIIRRKLAEDAEALALASVATTRSTAVADFYKLHLAGFLGRPMNGWKHLAEVRSPLMRIEARIADFDRFLAPDQRKVLGELAVMVAQKDGLDYQRSLQLSLKLWLFVHIPLTYSLLILTVLHVVIVFAFSGGAGAN